jgi:hypothetical protein
MGSDRDSIKSAHALSAYSLDAPMRDEAKLQLAVEEKEYAVLRPKIQVRIGWRLGRFNITFQWEPRHTSNQPGPFAW